jgi:CRP-like cAMP-binding protein
MLPADEQAIFNLPHVVRTIEAGTYILREADFPEMCGVLVSGFAYRQKITGEGSRQILAINIPGEAVDFQNLFLDVADHRVQMLTRGEVAFVPRTAMVALCKSSDSVMHAVVTKVLAESSIFREWITNVGRRDARSRAAHLLCELAVRLTAHGLAEEYGFQLPMTQELLADALGLTSVHVNRMLKSLEADGYITRTKRHVRFPDWERMRSIADFNERYLHLDDRRATAG